ncbi:triple functional domain protein-like isoform X2 [Actinia tenebrosa]|uniref:Triple functional domain protein-like isoform X2 n=1 Tax=Actinia tenebrosa TaxID=6105 RepID=A0A6P8HPN0_ACTTE|nr:triple functional domain protein-like isoform X2 [Actinia tenebrosa]
MAYHKYENSKKEEDLAGFEELSFQTHSYRPEYASYTDARRTERARKPERRIRAREIIENLRGNAASLCGGHDRQGRPIISILASRNDELNSEKLSETLRYLTQIPSNEVQGRGFTIIIDLRGSKWKSAKPMLRTLHVSQH